MLTYDPNNKFVGDANPNKVETISKEVFFHYNPFGEKCLTCLLWMEVKTPACIFECNYFIHPRSSNEAPIIECRCSSKDPLSVYLSRYNLSYDFNYNISYIFRSCKNNNTRIHHFNQNPYDDRKRNLGACSGQEHAGMHDNDINKIIGPMIVKTASFIYQLKIDIVNVLKKSKVKEKI